MVVIGALFAAVRFLADSSEDLLGTTGRSHIEVRQVVVINGRLDTRLVGSGFLQTEESTPQLDITVRNTGKDPALLTGVQITVEDSARLTVCEYHTGDAVAASRDYAIELPILPTPRERTFIHPLHQEVPAGEVDRFKALFRVPRSGEDNYVYALRVELLTEDSNKAVDVGHFVLGVPESVNRGGRILPEGPDPFGVLNGQERLLSTWCARRNLASIDRLLRHRGKRSEDMAALANLQLADWWPAFADRRSPQVAAESLLRLPYGGEPVLAVFAAERSGNRRLIEGIRRRAAALLLRRAEDALESGEPYVAEAAVLDARYALLFSPSREAWATLTRAETYLDAVEPDTPSGGLD